MGLGRIGMENLNKTANVVFNEVQWVKKLPQCLHILERLAWCETIPTPALYWHVALKR